MPELKEYCIRAAIRLKSGEIIEGKRHDNCLNVLRERGERRLNIIHSEQGFMTTLGRFVDRIEGMGLQKASGLPSRRSSDGTYCGDVLFSEDLY